MYEQQIFARQGWQCPVCGRVYSPDIMQCLYCANIEYKITAIGTLPDEQLRNHIADKIPFGGDVR